MKIIVFPSGEASSAEVNTQLKRGVHRHKKLKPLVIQSWVKAEKIISVFNDRARGGKRVVWLATIPERG